MSSDGKFALLDGLAEEFAERRRRGEHPALADYVQRFPELAAEIRNLFPAIAAMELAEAERRNDVEAEPPRHIIRQVVGDYRILREIGRGGMGIVYEAEQQSLGRRVALKVLPERIAGHGKALARFRREARAAARLHHTNIVPVFEVGQDGDVCFYAMQFIQGQALDEVLDELRRVRTPGNGVEQEPLIESNEAPDGAPSVRRLAESLVTGRVSLDDPALRLKASDGVDGSAITRTAPFADSTPTDVDVGRGSAVLPGQRVKSAVETNHRHYFRSVAQIGLQTASALAYAHTRGVVHRDVKPSNLLLDASGVVWVADFGLAKSEEEGLTEAGDVIGTFRYMAPERFRGEGDARADVYALGLTLYEMLALQPAFDERDRVKLMERVQREEPPRLRAIDPRIPRDLETIVLIASDKDPRRRYQTAEAMADDLRRFLADEPIAARRASLVERFARLCRRNPLTSALSMSVLALIVTTAVVASLSSLRLGLALDDMKKAKTDATDRLWGSYLAQARATQMSRRPGQSYEAIRAIREAMKLPIPEGRSIDELRNEAVAAILLPDLELEKEWSAVPPDSSGFDIDDRFERFAVADREGTVRVLTVEGDKELCTLPKMGALENYRGLKFSPDGTMLGQWNRQRVRLWRLASVEGAPLLDVAAAAYCFSSDGDRFVVADKEGEVRVYETQSGREIRKFSVGKTVIDVVWNPKLPQLLVGWKEGWAVWNVDKGELVIEKETSGPSWWFTWHPNGRWLASDPGLSIHLWDASTGRPIAPATEPHRNEGVVFRFDRAGDRLISNDWSSVLKLWDVRTGRRLLSMPARTRWFKFHRDDDRLVYATTAAVRIYRYRSGESVKSVQITESDGRATEVVDYFAAPTNRMIASPSGAKTLSMR